MMLLLLVFTLTTARSIESVNQSYIEKGNVIPDLNRGGEIVRKHISNYTVHT